MLSIHCHDVTKRFQRVDVLDRVLDKGVVIAGDIAINLLDIELLTIKIRLLIASADKAKELGIDWWARDPHLAGQDIEGKRFGRSRPREKLEQENRDLRERVALLESRLNSPTEQAGASRKGRATGG